MKKTLILLLFLFIAAKAFAQIDARNGYHLPTRGDFRIFAVFAEVKDDTLNFNNVYRWHRGQMPDSELIAMKQNYVNRYFLEASFGKLNVTIDYYPNLVQISMAENRRGIDTYEAVFRYLDALTIGGRQIQTAGGLNFPYNFDNWTLTRRIPPSNALGMLLPGSPKLPVRDGHIDFIMVFWRENSRIGPARGRGAIHMNLHRTSIGNKRVTIRSQIYADGTSIIIHEIAHGFLGYNNFHSGGAGAGTGMFMANYSGFSMLSSWNRYTPGYNPWDRFRLGWKYPRHRYAISVLNENDVFVNTDLIYGQPLSQGDSAVFILRDFASTGDAVRVKLPFVHTLNPDARGQWIWISNHQLLYGKMEYYERKHGQNSQMYRVPRGIYLNLQVGNNDFSVFNSRTNHFSPINRFGNFDFTAYSPASTAVRYSFAVGVTDDAHANPFTGVGLASFHPFDKNSNDTINNSEAYMLSGIRFNGIELGKENFPYGQYSFYGSVFDAFFPGDKISISTNPAPIPRYTYRTRDRFHNEPPFPAHANDDNRHIFLNGLAIRVLEQRANGVVKISIRWNDFAVRNDVRWTGDIILHEQVNLLSGNTILLAQGLTPTRPVNPVYFNGRMIFADPTRFTAKNGSIMNLQPHSRVILREKSSFILESGANLTIQDGAEIIVQSGSTFMIQSGANLTIQGSGRLTIEEGAFLCVEDGANIRLQEFNSVIAMMPGASYGAHLQIFPNAVCLTFVEFTGTGAVVDFSRDVFIQNTTITNSRFVGGRRIYAGRNVTTTIPQGNVYVINNSKLILEALEYVILDAGFEVVPGAELEIR